jgi:hypothetical protein
LSAEQIDLFGEISGVSFTPMGDELFVGVADLTYSSSLEVGGAVKNKLSALHEYNKGIP